MTGLMYAKNAVENEWMGDIKVVFFGPSERLIVEDEDIQKYAIEISDTSDCFACKYLSDEDDISDEIEKLGVKVEYVGSIISDYINEGYTPMVW